jgi:hypothetical protein
MEAHADRAAGDDELLDPAVGREGVAQLRAVEPGHQEVGVPGGPPEQLVADDAADDVG